MTSAENQQGGREAICDLIDFTARKDCARTRTRREPIAHWTKASSRRCLVIHSCLQKVRDNRIRKQENPLSNYAGITEDSFRSIPSKAVYDRLAADVFVYGRNVEEMLRAEGFAAYLGGGLDGVMDTRQTLQ